MRSVVLRFFRAVCSLFRADERTPGTSSDFSLLTGDPKIFLHAHREDAHRDVRGYDAWCLRRPRGHGDEMNPFSTKCRPVPRRFGCSSARRQAVFADVDSGLRTLAVVGVGRGGGGQVDVSKLNSRCRPLGGVICRNLRSGVSGFSSAENTQSCSEAKWSLYRVFSSGVVFLRPIKAPRRDCNLWKSCVFQTLSSMPS